MKVAVYEVPENMKSYVEEFKGFKINIDELLEENHMFAREHGLKA